MANQFFYCEHQLSSPKVKKSAIPILNKRLVGEHLVDFFKRIDVRFSLLEFLLKQF